MRAAPQRELGLRGGVPVLAVDAGQTEIRAALAHSGRGPSTATAPGVLRMGERTGPEEVAAALLAAVAALGPLPEPLPPLGVGLTSLLGALGDRDGAVVAAGTGAVCVARRGERLAKVDGWGALLGDAGSGFAIGRAGLDAALRHADGRGGSAALLRAAERRYAPLPDLSERIYAAEVPTRAVAAFAADVAREAAAGEPRAAAILAEAARELALSAYTALDRLFDPSEPVAVSYAGNVFRAGAPLLEPFTQEVLRRRPATELLPPAGDSLAGAALLAGMEDGLRPQAGLLWRAAA